MADKLPPRIGHVFRLADIICDAMADSEGKTIDPITLAQKILNDPRNQWAPAPTSTPTAEKLEIDG